MSITATRVRGDRRTPADHYTCTRCGHEAKFCLSRGKPTLCRDTPHPISP